MDLYGIIGAGGFGREVMPLARSMLGRHTSTEAFELVFVLDAPVETSINGHRVLSTDAFLASPGTRWFNVAIADGVVRRRLAETLEGAGAKPFSIIAPNALVMDNNHIGDGAILCPFVVVTSNARIGRYFHANLHAYVAHDCVVGDFVTFAPKVACNGNVRIGDHAYLGTGAMIRQGRPERPMLVGTHAVVGMGAVVTRDVEPNTTVIGNPARPMVAQS